MFDGFGRLVEWSVLPSDAVSELQEHGFAVLHDAVPAGQMEPLTAAYTAAVASATGDDIRIGRASTRVSDFVNRGAAFDKLSVFPPPARVLLSGHRTTVGRPRRGLHRRWCWRCRWQRIAAGSEHTDRQRDDVVVHRRS